MRSRGVSEQCECVGDPMSHTFGLFFYYYFYCFRDKQNVKKKSQKVGDIDMRKRRSG